MKIQLPCSLGASRSFVGKDGKNVVLIGLNFMGGRFQVVVPERLVPDALEGREVMAGLELSSDAAGKPRLRLLDFSEATS